MPLRSPLAGLALAPLLLSPGTALAQRPSTPALTCAQAKGLVLRSGGLVLGTGGQTYDRFVRDRSFCEPTEVTKRAFVPTRTDPACFVGYTCTEPGRDWFEDE